MPSKGVAHRHSKKRAQRQQARKEARTMGTTWQKRLAQLKKEA